MELREAINAAIDEEQPDVPAQETEAEAQQLAAPEADGDVPEQAQADPEKPAAAEVDPKSDVDPADKAAAQVPTGQHRVDRAPASWRKEAKGEWANVPLHIRQEVHKREMEITRALSDAHNARQAAQQFEQVAQPYMARIQGFGISPQQAFGELLKADYLLATGTPQTKAQLIDKMIQDYGIDIGELDSVISSRLNGQQAPQQQQQMPNIEAIVQQQLRQALAPIYQQQEQQAMQVQQQAEQTIEQMSLDPKYPHFDEVRQDMADIIELGTKRGVALTLDQAYSRAVAMNPDLSAYSVAAQQNQVARRAKAAAVSISGAPASTTSSHVSSGNMRDDILAALGGGRL